MGFRAWGVGGRLGAQCSCSGERTMVALGLWPPPPFQFGGGLSWVAALTSPECEQSHPQCPWETLET